MRKTHVQTVVPTLSKPTCGIKKETLRPLSAPQLTLAVGGNVKPTLTGNCY